MGEQKTFIFDLDDTLMYNLHDYSQSILDFTKLVIDRIGPRAPDIPTIINLEDKIDSNRVKEWLPFGKGFSKERFPTSLTQTYREITKPLGINDKEGEELAYKIGTEAFNVKRWKKQGLIPGVMETIDYLKKGGDELILMTKGDIEIQRMKIKANKLESMFSETHIVPSKDYGELNYTVGNRKKSSVWHVGNSMKSDIIPAIDVGIGAIYIPLETWSYEKSHSAPPKYNRLFKIHKISDIKNIYHKL